MKRFDVVLTAGARRDLEGIHAYIAEQDSPQRADSVLDRLATTLRALSTHPERGAVPAELRSLGVRTIRQVLDPPYRIIYRPEEARVVVHLIADGRRDMQTLLAGRLLQQ